MKIKSGDIVRFKKSFGGPAIEDCRIIYFISTKRGVYTYHTGVDPVTDLKLKDKDIIEIVGHNNVSHSKYYRKIYKLKEIINRTSTYYPDYDKNNYWYWSEKRMDTIYKKLELKKNKASNELKNIYKLLYKPF